MDQEIRNQLVALVKQKKARSEFARRKKTEPLKYWKPLPSPSTQKDFIACNKKIVTAFGGNRSGKSEAGAKKILDIILNKPYSRAYAATENYRFSVNVQQRKIWELSPKNRIKKGSYDPVKGFHDAAISYDNESTIFFKSYDSGREAYQGDDLDVCWMDEEPPFAIWNEAMMRLIDRRGQMILTMTGLKGFTELVREVYEKENASREFFRFHMEDNAFLSKVEVKNAIENMPEDERDARLYGTPMMKSGLVFKTWQDRKPWVIDPIDISPKSDDFSFYTAIDPHLKLPIYALLVAIDKEDAIYVIDELMCDGLVEDFINMYKAKWGEYRIEEGWIDPSAASVDDKIYGNSIWDQLSDADIMVSSAKKDPSERISLMNMGFKLREYKGTHIPDIQVFKNCTELRKELKWYIWDDYSNAKTADRREAKNIARKKDDHLIDCLGYIMCGNARFEDPFAEAKNEPIVSSFAWESYM